MPALIKAFAILVGAQLAWSFAVVPITSFRNSVAGKNFVQHTACTLKTATGLSLRESVHRRRADRAAVLRDHSITRMQAADDGPVYGDTSGAILSVEDVSISAGERDIVTDITWRVMQDERVGLVGPNGAGKSTLLSAVAGRRMLDKGRIQVKPGTSVGYLVQTAVSGSNRTAWDEAKIGMFRVRAAEERVAAAQARCAAAAPDDEREIKAAAEELAAAQYNYVSVGGDSQDLRIARVLDGLGFTRADHNRSCTSFSGGWQMRVALARLLLSEPDLLLLDEPTNHLDLQAKRWLIGYLSQYKGTIVLVTHEESLLDGAGCTGIVEVRDRRLHTYRGGYARYLAERQLRAEQAVKAYEAQQEEIAKLQGYIDRFGAKASKASSAQSRQKQLDKIERVEAPQDLTKAARPRLILPSPPKCRSDMVVLKGATFGWDEHKPLCRDVTLTIERGMRLAILGPNGAGKSTLLWALAGRLPLSAGRRVTTESLQLGLFTQDLAQELPGDRAGLDIVLDSVQLYDATIDSEKARSAMGALGLSGGKALQAVHTLSGGEKARVALSMFVLVPHNLLLLDEPSNHLDVNTVKALTQALQEWEGTVVVVTHNRAFCDQLNPTHTAFVEGGGVKLESRPPREADWSRIAAWEAAEVKPSAEEEAAKVIKASAYQESKRKGNAPKRIQKIEKEVAKLEQELADLDVKILANGSKWDQVMELQKQRDQLSAAVEALYSEWAELEA